MVPKLHWASQVPAMQETGLIPGSGRSPGGGPGTPVFLPGESHGQKRLAGYSSKSHKESDTTEVTYLAHTHALIQYS